MASVYEKPPIFCKERLWVEKDLKSLEKRKFQENHMKAEVYTYGGDLGMEFFLSKTLPDFMSAGNRVNWTWPQSFEEFGNVLDGSPKTVWEEVLHSKPLLDRNLATSFNECIIEFIKKSLNNKHPRDQQWIYLSPMGDNKTNRFFKDLKMSPVDHLRRFREIHRLSLTLPAGNIADPSDQLLVEWLYMSYHHNDRAKYVESGKCLDDETLDSLTDYFQAIWEQRRADGTLTRQEQQRDSRTQRSSADDRRRDSDRRRNDSRSSSRSSRERRDNRHDYRDRDRPRDRNSDTSYRSRESSNNSSRSREASSASSKPKALNGPPCHEHSRDGQPARHTWAECSRNPANRKGSSNDRRAHDAHHVDAGYRSDDSNRSGNSHHTPVPSDHDDDDSVASADDNYAVFDEPMKPASRKDRHNTRRGYDNGRDNKRRRSGATKYHERHDDDDDHYAVEASSPRDDTNPLDF